MLQAFLCKFFAKVFYPTNSKDWYKSKEYRGADNNARFADFMLTQRTKGALFYKEFLSLQLTRQYIISGDNQLDSVLVTPDQNISRDKAGSGLYFIMFYGKGEYYESRFRDMARQAKATGASVLSFNHKGMHCSSGETSCLAALVDDGIAVVEFLLQRGVHHEQIILQGNSLGAGIQAMVSERYRVMNGFSLRQINSNSFKSLSAVIANRYKVTFLERFFDVVLNYAGWEIVPDSDFYRTGPYRCHLRRLGDKTILPSAEYHIMVDFEADQLRCPDAYKITHKWLYEHNQLTYIGKSEEDPHELGLHHFYIKNDSGEYFSVYDLINRYLLSFKVT
ncbi:MAG: hypothetical protein NWS20_03270 [Rickettsiaceae bacterium]|nr:hypothetical protein [Rickettsiaceae bacterium]MDP4832602.1 hypothetical protein [Rickettsiaceae bacterium]MDP5021159.1 hypothetical protein [Rickettsiaceae bacterium]MDP5083396.1 hypothetical protein [Rickettsiaceae bacterium]